MLSPILAIFVGISPFILPLGYLGTTLRAGAPVLPRRPTARDTCDVMRSHGGRVGEATVERVDVKRRIVNAWCPWSVDSDDDDRTTSNTVSGTRHSTSWTATAADAARRRFIGGTTPVTINRIV